MGDDLGGKTLLARTINTKVIEDPVLRGILDSILYNMDNNRGADELRSKNIKENEDRIKDIEEWKAEVIEAAQVAEGAAKETKAEKKADRQWLLAFVAGLPGVIMGFVALWMFLKGGAAS